MSNLISYHCGLDLAKEFDFSCVCILKKITPIVSVRGKGFQNGQPSFQVLTLKRFPLRTNYTQIVLEISNRLKYPPFDDYQQTIGGGSYPVRVPVHLAFDKGGTGQAVAELLENDAFLDKRLESLTGIVITGGNNVNEGASSLNVPKKDLIFGMLILFEQGYLKFPADLPELDALLNEFQSFQMKYTKAGNTQFAATGTNHDDMILSLSLACYSARNTDDGFAERRVLADALNYNGKGRMRR